MYTAMAADRFIVKYKLTESQKVFLASHAGAGAKEARARIRKELREKLSNGQIDALSKAAEVKEAAKIQVTDWHSLGDGAHVIILSEDLSEAQTKKFISNVSQYDDIESIEEDKELKVFSVPNPTYQWDMTSQKEFSAEPTWSGDSFNRAWTVLDSYGYLPGKNITFAVLDTGYTPHPNFINNLQTTLEWTSWSLWLQIYFRLPNVWRMSSMYYRYRCQERSTQQIYTKRTRFG